MYGRISLQCGEIGAVRDRIELLPVLVGHDIIKR